jgi:phosphate transport system substrate-binding protein
MQPIRLFFPVFLVAVLACGTRTTGTKLVLEGSTTVLPIAQAAAEEYMDRHADADIVVRGGGSGVGITSLIEGTCDIADASRAIKDDERRRAAARGRTPVAHVIALDGIAVIVNPRNPVRSMTLRQIRDIYTGRAHTWRQFGGDDIPIVVISRDSASGTFEAFGDLALDKQRVRPDALMQASNQTIVSIVAGAAGAIGYVGAGYVSGAVRAVAVDGILPSRETILSRSYPLARPLFMYTDGAGTGPAQDFISFILSPEGQRLVENEGFIPLQQGGP